MGLGALKLNVKKYMVFKKKGSKAEILGSSTRVLKSSSRIS